MRLLPALLFALSANIDCLAIGLSYGIQSVKIDGRSNLVIALLSTAGTLLSMLAGSSLTLFCSPKMANALGSFLMMGIGLWIMIQERCGKKKNLKEYDRDASGVIDIKEAIVLGFALSINNIGLGISGSITGLPLFTTCLFTFLCSLLFIAMAQRWIQNKASKWIHSYANTLAALLIFLLGCYELLA